MIHVEKASEEKLTQLNVRSWPVWTKEISEFPWKYDEAETCFILEGDVEVIMPDEQVVRIRKGDFVVFSKGLECIWKVHSPVRKHYKFG